MLADVTGQVEPEPGQTETAQWRAEASQWRAQFDAEVRFANGGGLRTEGFRLDIPGTPSEGAGTPIEAASIGDASIGDDELAALFVRHLGLLMVAEVRISNKTIIQEAHKGSRGVAVSPAAVSPAAVSPAAVSSAAVSSPVGARRMIELSHVIRDGMVTLPGFPAPRITDWMSWADSHERYAPGTEFHIGRIDMIANTGTYVDTPAHRWAGQADLAGVPLDRLADLPGIVVRVPAGTRAVDRLILAPYEVAGRAVLLHTGWDEHFDTERYGSLEHPYLTGDGAQWLVEAGAALVGIDSINIDDLGPAAAGTRPAHSALLAAGIPIVEHLRGLDQLPPDGFRFTAAPPLVEGMGTFPVRAFAVLDPA